VLVIPVARADDVVGHAQRGELPVQAVTKWSGFVTGNDPPTLGNLFSHPHRKILRFETLRRLGTAAVVLHGHDVLLEMHIQSQFEHACGGRLRVEVSYRLRRRNRRSRNISVRIHSADNVERVCAPCLPTCFLLSIDRPGLIGVGQ
jgi:hypothetical protein